MVQSCVVRVARADPALSAGICALQVTPEQAAYVGDPVFNLGNALQDPLSEAMAILADDTVVGFYRLDFSAHAITGHPYAAGSVGLRAFLIDRRRQGGGLGAQAAMAMCADVAVRHPQCRVLLLAVHGRNRAAIATYRKAGFVDTGHWLAGGRAGPQQLMVRALTAAVAPRTAMGESVHG
jgi:GNAT superfamily N-acetyltransferase